MATSAEQIRTWQGPAILSYGYRPFFLGGALCAALSVPVWIMLYMGSDVFLPLTDKVAPMDWHVHSMLFSYLWAVVAGFLMTAVPNWTGRFPIVGWSLFGFFCLWLISWFAFALSSFLPVPLIFILDLAFPFVFFAAIAREIIKGKNTRNLKVLILIGLLILANAHFDYEALNGMAGADSYGARLALGVAIMLICVIGGRIIPSFTRNWIARHNGSDMPVPHNRFDQIVMAASAVSLISFVLFPDIFITGLIALIVGVLHLMRLVRWKFWHILRDSLVWVLHLGYLFIPLGFIVIALADFNILEGGRSYAQHVWMAGGIGMMTMAVMTRASLGHAGRPLKIGWGVTSLYLLLLLAVVCRFVSGVLYNSIPLLHFSGTCWTLAFLGFVVLYWNILTKPRVPKVPPQAP